MNGLQRAKIKWNSEVQWTIWGMFFMNCLQMTVFVLRLHLPWRWSLPMFFFLRHITCLLDQVNGLRYFFHAPAFLHFGIVKITVSLNGSVTVHYTLIYNVDSLRPWQQKTNDIAMIFECVVGGRRGDRQDIVEQTDSRKEDRQPNSRVDRKPNHTPTTNDPDHQNRPCNTHVCIHQTSL